MVATDSSLSLNTFQMLMELLLPAGTDVRAPWNAGKPDLVECPAGSGRFYAVAWVDDIGKNFPNEHRIAWLVYFSAFVPPGGSTGFPASSPVPLP